MNSVGYIARLLERHSQNPLFPFSNWANDPTEFSALRAFWDEILKAAAGEVYANYQNTIEPRMDEGLSPYDMMLHDRRRRVEIRPWPEGGTFLLIGNFATDHYAPDRIEFGEWPDRTWFSIATDLDPYRLAAVFEMIEKYVLADFMPLDEEVKMDQIFGEQYANLFTRSV
jgi:hypothetical protein